MTVLLTDYTRHCRSSSRSPTGLRRRRGRERAPVQEAESAGDRGLPDQSVKLLRTVSYSMHQQRRLRGSSGAYLDIQASTPFSLHCPLRDDILCLTRRALSDSYRCSAKLTSVLSVLCLSTNRVSATRRMLSRDKQRLHAIMPVPSKNSRIRRGKNVTSSTKVRTHRFCNM